MEDEFTHSLAEVWDLDVMRGWALDPEAEVDRKTFMEAWGELFNTVLTITSVTVPMIAGDDDGRPYILTI